MSKKIVVALALFGSFAFQALAEEPAKAPAPYVPGLGDLMTAYVQPHHTKLWLAGSAGNWPLAGYEAKELGESFEDVSGLQGNWHDFPVAKLVESNIEPALGGVEKAIAAKDKAGFAKSYDALTAACNACHAATQNQFLVIKRPGQGAFPDQEFAVPSRPAP